MRTLIAIAQLVLLTVITISVMREFKNAEAGRNQRMQLLQHSLAAPTEPPDSGCVLLIPSAPIT